MSGSTWIGKSHETVSFVGFVRHVRLVRLAEIRETGEHLVRFVSLVRLVRCVCQMYIKASPLTPWLPYPHLLSGDYFAFTHWHFLCMWHICDHGNMFYLILLPVLPSSVGILCITQEAEIILLASFVIVSGSCIHHDSSLLHDCRSLCKKKSVIISILQNIK